MLQPSQRLLRLAFRISIEYFNIAETLNRPRRSEEFNRHDDQPDEPQHKEHKRPNHDNGGQQPPLGNEPEDDGDEDYAETRDGDVVPKVPVPSMSVQQDR